MSNVARTPTSKNTGKQLSSVPSSSLATLSTRVPDPHLDLTGDSEEESEPVVPTRGRAGSTPGAPTTATSSTSMLGDIKGAIDQLLAGHRVVLSTLEEHKSELDALKASREPQEEMKSQSTRLQGVPAGRTRQVLARSAAANGAILGMDPINQAKLEELLNSVDDEEDDLVRHQTTHTTTHTDTTHKQQSGTYRSEIMPLKGSEKQDLASLLAEAVTVKAKTVKKFKDMEHLQKEMEDQLAAFIDEDKSYSARVSNFLLYSHMLFRMAGERGMDAVNFYHWRLFERIGEGRHDPNTQAYQAVDLLISVQTNYVLLPPQKSKKVGASFATSAKKQQQNRASTNTRTTNPSSATGTFPAGSCPIHPQSTTHNAAQCRSSASKAGH
jgi:hypothetical protein